MCDLWPSWIDIAEWFYAWNVQEVSDYCLSLVVQIFDFVRVRVLRQTKQTWEVLARSCRSEKWTALPANAITDNIQATFMTLFGCFESAPSNALRCKKLCVQTTQRWIRRTWRLINEWCVLDYICSWIIFKGRKRIINQVNRPHPFHVRWTQSRSNSFPDHPIQIAFTLNDRKKNTHV